MPPKGKVATPVGSSVSRNTPWVGFPVAVRVIATSPVGVPAPPVTVTVSCTVGSSCWNEVTGVPFFVIASVMVGVPDPMPLCQPLISFATSTLPRPDAASYPAVALYAGVPPPVAVKPPTQFGLPEVQATLLVPAVMSWKAPGVAAAVAYRPSFRLPCGPSACTTSAATPAKPAAATAALPPALNCNELGVPFTQSA